MAKVKGIIVEIGGDTSKLQAALKEVNSSTSSLSKELKGVNSLRKGDMYVIINVIIFFIFILHSKILQQVF